MERALEKPVANPAYLEFFGLTRHPFARLNQPTEIFHTEQYSLLSDHLAAVAGESDSFLMICGSDGCGKTTQLGRFISGVNLDTNFSIVDGSCEGGAPFYSRFLERIGFTDITGSVNELQNITRQFLVNRGMANDPVLIIIDNAQLMVPAMLEQLRWISEVKVKECRPLSVVLAGNADLTRVINSSTMAQAKFKRHIEFNIRNYTAVETANYVWHRLRLAGGNEGVKISKQAYPLIHRYSGGTPEMINKVCNDILTEAFNQKTRVITDNLLRTVADNHRLVPHVIPLHGKGRRKSDPDYRPGQADADPTGHHASGLPAVESAEIQDHLTQLAEQLDVVRADKLRALEHVDERDKDITQLRQKLKTQQAEMEKLARTLAGNAGEIAQQNQALTSSVRALQESESATKELTEDLVREKREREAAQKELAAATAAVENLSRQSEIAAKKMCRYEWAT